MTDQDNVQTQLTELLTLNEFSHPAWDEPVVCRVEVDLAAWLCQLAGGHDWEVYSEEEDDTCISFSLRDNDTEPKPKLAEVTLYHNGYAVVDVEGESLFDGALTTGTTHFANLSYYHAESGEPITLN